MTRPIRRTSRRAGIVTTRRIGRDTSSRRGIATVAAVVLIGLAAMVFVALTALVGHDLRRTARASGEAQLRQLLLAGETAAAATLDQPATDVEQQVSLPRELSVETATVAFRTASATEDARSISVDAAVAGLRASQRLTYRRRDGRWTLVAAELSPTSGVANPNR